jgi:8-hydroxy-5-deazaflavin:NADPH oxidoreductase
MRVGILGGTGPAGRALGTRLAANGVDVVLGSRSVERGEEIAAEVRGEWPALPLSLTGGTNLDAASCDIVVLATPWDGAVATALELAPTLEGKVLVSMVNALTRIGREFQALVPVRGSIAATVQAVLPKTEVTAAFQHLPARELGAVDRELVSDVLICADTSEGGRRTVELVETMPGLRGVQAGSLASANAVEALTAVLLNVNIKYKSHVALRLEGLVPLSAPTP